MHVTMLYDEDFAKVRKFLSRKPSIRHLMSLAASRLILARRRVSIGNQAIDVGVCLESIFCSDGERGEITYRLALRAALFLEEDVDRREKLRTEVRDLYALRSKAAHGFQGDWTAVEAQTAKRGLQIAASALDKLIELDELPVWRQWENSGGKPSTPPLH
jgi:hypothetical protein